MPILSYEIRLYSAGLFCSFLGFLPKALQIATVKNRAIFANLEVANGLLLVHDPGPIYQKTPASAGSRFPEQIGLRQEKQSPRLEDQSRSDLSLFFTTKSPLLGNFSENSYFAHLPIHQHFDGIDICIYPGAVFFRQGILSANLFSPLA